MRSFIIGIGLAVALASASAEARRSRSSSTSSKKNGPVCKKGKACGNSCIAQSAVCHQSKGTARNADEAEQPPKTER